MKRLDLDGDQSIDFDEFIAAAVNDDMLVHRVRHTCAQLTEAVTPLSLSQPICVVLGMFAASVSSFHVYVGRAHIKEDVLRAAFRSLDKNGDGYIARTEPGLRP